MKNSLIKFFYVTAFIKEKYFYREISGSHGGEYEV
jgi:hypothetical protein